MVVGPASLARLQRESDLLLEDLEHVRNTANAGDARLRTAVLRDWAKREERLVARLDYLRSVLDRAHVAPIGELGDTAWPGAVIRYRDEESGETYDAVVGAVDLTDDAYERVSPSSPLGKLLASARVGQRMSFTKPNGESTVVEIVSLSD
jgi:transcription elongation GreA/GreB family factor